jgi:RimJ/RimL family protein N-acetyltransferase
VSLSLLYGHSDDVAHWVAQRLPYIRERVPHVPYGQVFGNAVGIGVVGDTGLVAGVVYHSWDPQFRSIEVSCAAASPRWGNRQIFSGLLRYAWETAECRRITAVTPRRAPPGATSPRKFLEGLGFVREGSIRLGFGDQNAIVYGLLREDWEAGRFCRPRRGLSGGEEGRQAAHAA